MKLPERLKLIIRVLISKVLYPFYGKRRSKIFEEQEKEGIQNIPIFIISYNRLSYVKAMVEQLEHSGLKNIIIIDNNSSYVPLIDYYNSIPYKVIRLNENGGHLVFWKNDEFKKYRKGFYVVTDPDLQIIEECPADFMNKFFAGLKKYPFVRKVGFSLKIDDLPDTGIFSLQVIKWEKQYYKTKIAEDNLYYAGIDTTFAMYIPDILVKKQKFLSAFRTGYPYQVRHLPWYKKKDEISDEDVFYSDHKTNGWWDGVKGLMEYEAIKPIDSDRMEK